MPESVYEVLSQGMRYFFALLGVLLVWRAMAWQLTEHRARHRRLKRLPDAGMIGELVVTRGCRGLAEGTVFPMPYEGTLGAGRGCDLLIPCVGTARQHLDFSFQPRCGVLLYLRAGQTCVMDGKTLTARSKPRRYPMVHGSTLTIGDCELRLRLFAGLETVKRRVPHRAAPKQSVDETVRYVEPYHPPEESKTARQPRRAGKAEPPPIAAATHPRPFDQTAATAKTGVVRRSPNVPPVVNDQQPSTGAWPAADADAVRQPTPKKVGARGRRRSHAEQAQD